jgi:hypothetical protein
MRIRGHLTEKSSTVRISATRTVSYILLQHQQARSTLVASTSGLSEKPRVNPVGNVQNQTGSHITVPVKFSKNKSNKVTSPCLDEKSSRYTVQRDA